MINQRVQALEANPPMAKQKRMLAAVAQEIVTNEVDDIVADGMDICDIIDNHHSLKPGQSVTSNDLRSLGESIRNTLLEINEIREQNRERRHRELLEVLTKIAQHNSSTEKCDEVKTVVNCSSPMNINKECLNTTKDPSTGHHEIEENIQKLLNNSNKASQIHCSTTAQQQGFNHNNSDQIPKSLNFVDEKTTKGDSGITQVTQTKCKTNARPTILRNRQIVTANRTITVKHNTKEELQQMRAKMLEVQRKKMEDRERKKKQMQLLVQRQ